MGVVDYAFYLDRYKNNAAVGNVLILDAKAGDNLVETIKNNIKNNINKSIIHRSQIQESPFRNDYPYLVEFNNLEIDQHIFEHNKDGDDLQIKDIYDYISGKRLEDDKPLWDIHIVYNINSDKDIAIFRRYHHCLGDSDAHAQVHDIICDNFIGNNIKMDKKISKLKSIKSHYIKIAKYAYLYSMGFLFKNNKIEEDRPNRKDLYKGSWMRKSSTDQGLYFFKVNVKDYKNIINQNNISILNASVYAISETYSKIFENKNKNNLTILSLFPISYRKKNSKPHGNMAISTYLDLKLNEKNKAKKLFLLQKELSQKINLVKKSPRFAYGKAIEIDPRPSQYKKSWESFNKNNWNKRKKIPKKEKESIFVSTSISFKKIEKTKYLINGVTPKELYNYSMPVPTPGSIGCTISVRYSDDHLYIGVSYIKDLYKNPEFFEEFYTIALKEILEII